MRDLNRTKLNVNWLCMFFMSMVLKFAEPPILMISTSHANRDVLVLFTGWWRWLNVVATHERPPADEITHGHVSTDWWVKTKTLQPSPLPGTEGSQVAQEEEQQARRACPVVKGVCVCGRVGACVLFQACSLLWLLQLGLFMCHYQHIP